MTETRLETRDGGLVVVLLIPTFRPPADAIRWGDRVFFRTSGEAYREGMVYHASEVQEIR